MSFLSSKAVRVLRVTTSRSASSSSSWPFRTTTIRHGTSKSFHIDTPDNTVDAKFDFTEENYKRVEMILAKYPSNYKQSGIIPLLDLAQRQSGGWLPVAAMLKVAQICGVADARVYEVASFYTMFNRTRVGTYFLQLCGTTPCMICGAQEIKNTIQEELGIRDGETTRDGMFTLLEVECLGACANAPMLQANDDYYECLSVETTKQLLNAMKEGKPPAMGKWGSLPMNGQVSCEGPLGKTTLFEKPTPPKVDKNRFKDGKVDPASVKQHMAY
jgi:NADH dehydrogenase (ubiquinone) flavoprotein 2